MDLNAADEIDLTAAQRYAARVAEKLRAKARAERLGHERQQARRLVGAFAIERVDVSVQTRFTDRGELRCFRRSQGEVPRELCGIRAEAVARVLARVQLRERTLQRR